jgi:hypothetical protein
MDISNIVMLKFYYFNNTCFLCVALSDFYKVFTNIEANNLIAYTQLRNLDRTICVEAARTGSPTRVMIKFSSNRKLLHVLHQKLRSILLISLIKVMINNLEYSSLLG